MKKILLFFGLLILTFWKGQTVNGYIVNDASQKIADVNIYLDGTKIGTTSNKDGQFQLDVNGQSKGVLVFQKENYETFTIKASDYFDKKLKVVLNKMNEIEEIKLIPFTEEAYRNYIHYFLSAFIGNNQEDVKIKNQRTLKFSYDKDQKFLKVKAPKTLIIENKALGYEIQYNLINFSVDFNTKIQKFSGTSFFKETKNTSTVKLNRMNAYSGSLMHFLRSLTSNNANEEGFVINKIIKVKNPKYPSEEEIEKLNDHMKISKSTKTINFPEDILDISRRKNSQSEFALALVQRNIPQVDYTKKFGDHLYLEFPDILQVQYKKFPYERENKAFVKSTMPINQSSYIYVEGDSFEIYKDGNLSDPDSLLTDGDFAKNKIENMLPLDYE